MPQNLPTTKKNGAVDVLPSFNDFILAVEKVKKTLYKITKLLNEDGIPYAVIGGNAVAAWVAAVDESAVRATKDIDLLVNARDMDRITDLFQENGFIREDLRSLIVFVDVKERNRRKGIHIVVAGEKVLPSYLHPAPDLTSVTKSAEGFIILDFFSLVKMKLTSFRDKDRVHIGDMLSVGLITTEIKKRLPGDLRERLETIINDYENY